MIQFLVFKWTEKSSPWIGNHRLFLVFNWTEVRISYGFSLVSWMTTKNEELATCVIKRALLENHRTGGVCRWEKNGERINYNHRTS